MSFMTDPAIFEIAPQQMPLLRPAALIRAAKAGQAGWRRDRDLPRLLGRESLPSNPAALRILRAAEHAADSARREGRADYDLHRHVRLIIALLAEMRLQAEAAPQPVDNVIAFSARGTARPARRA